jgi:hypothetical protein
MTPQIKISGTHATVKLQMPVTQVLSNIHPQQPMKGTNNPPHIQVNISKFYQKVKDQK